MEDLPEWFRIIDGEPPENERKKLQNVLLKIIPNIKGIDNFIEILYFYGKLYARADYADSRLKQDCEKSGIKPHERLKAIRDKANELKNILYSPTPKYISNMIERSLHGHDLILNEYILKHSGPDNRKLDAFRLQLSGFIDALEGYSRIQGMLEKAERPEGKKRGISKGLTETQTHEFIDNVAQLLKSKLSRIPTYSEIQKVIATIFQFQEKSIFKKSAIQQWIKNQK